MIEDVSNGETTPPRTRAELHLEAANIRLQCLHIALHSNLPPPGNADEAIVEAGKLLAFVEGVSA